MHEDVVAHLRPRWLFSKAVVTTCWWPKNKKANAFDDTGDTRTGCLVLLHADRLAATDEPATTDVARLDELFRGALRQLAAAAVPLLPLRLL